MLLVIQLADKMRFCITMDKELKKLNLLRSDNMLKSYVHTNRIQISEKNI